MSKLPIPVATDWFSRPSGPGACATCGLFRADAGTKQHIPVPLRRRDVSATVYAAASFSDTKETLSYVSDAECSAVFRFPLPPRAAVYRFRAVFGDREVVTKVKPRAAAREEFDLAVSQGHSAVHMSQHEAGASVFEVSLGNLEAHTEVTVEFSYLRLLDAFGGTLEWSHTATFAAKVTYALSYEVTVRAEAGTVRAIESPEAVAVERPVPSTSAGAGEEEVWRVRLSEQVADPSKDLTLAIELDPKAARRSGLRVQRTPTSRGGEQRTVALATFVPPLPSAAASAAAGESSKQQLRKEIWFVVDCSGSMGGRPIEQAREAALFFVRDLPVDSGVRFNVTVFGSSHNSLYNSCKPYDSKTEKEAVAWIQNKVHANLGGTEMLQTLESIYMSPIAAGYTREIIFLTDGGVSGHEEERIIKELVSRHGVGSGHVPKSTFAGFGGVGRPQPPKPTEACGTLGPFGPFANHWASNPPAPGATPEQLLEGLEAAMEAKAAVFREYGVALPPRLQEELDWIRGDLSSFRFLRNARRTHVLSMGIGHGVHRGVLDGMAAASNGEAVFVVEGEGIAAKAAFLKKVAVGCHGLVNVRVRASSALVRMAPHVLPQRVFAGEPLHVLMEVVSAEPDASVELTAEWADPAAAGGAAPLTLCLPLGPALASSAEEGEALPVLHAMAYIGSLMAGTSPLHVRPDGTPLAAPPSADTVKEAVVRLAVAEHLVTPHTSAVGVSLRRDPAAPEAGANVVEVPLQLPHGRNKMWSSHNAAALASHQGRFLFGASAPLSGLFGQTPTQAPPSLGGATFGAPAAATFSIAAAIPAFGAPAAAPCFGVSTAPSFSTFGAQPDAASTPRAVPPAFGFGASTPAFTKPLGFSFGSFSTACTSNASSSSPPAQPAVADSGVRPFGAALAGNGGVLFGAPPAAQRTAAEEEDAKAACVPQLLSQLNLQRTTDGCWVASAELAGLLGQTPESLAALHPVRPAGLTSDDAWATVVVLAVLRRCLAAQREVWADMEAKALGWLAAAWPAAAAADSDTQRQRSISVGSTVLKLAKALERIPKV
ncbi:hypothetical protein HYH02_009335 [Chlamydomonas schloesseri]|uniref:VWFA domain-containing protein n=1 Tax=Chlamydomonas schloesseri TaxID=2026947 RepID=A0A835W7C5_9CHLO|nr:hypothetical protein HYH02_009335 [Chlamydomonas schloesseri]|eukprot:KAG2443262.1 hypothetical protein HYH02_009335 [Chlamydomonas schloesseri]